MVEKVIDGTLAVKVAKRRKEAEKKKKEELTLAEKLMIRGFEQTVEIPFESKSLGTFPVEVRVPLMAEYGRLIELYGLISSSTTSGDVEKAVAYSDEMYGLIASMCVDESLDFDFFKSGYFSTSDIIKIITEVIQTQQEKNEQIASFRKKR